MVRRLSCLQLGHRLRFHLRNSRSQERSDAAAHTVANIWEEDEDFMNRNYAEIICLFLEVYKVTMANIFYYDKVTNIRLIYNLYTI